MVAPLIAVGARTAATAAGRGAAAGLKNARRVGADARRTRPTTSERYLRDVKQGTDAYRSIRRQKNTNEEEKEKENNRDFFDRLDTFLDPVTKARKRRQRAALRKVMLGPEQQKGQSSSLHSVRKKISATRSTGMFLSFATIPYIISVFFAIVSWIGIGGSIMGEDFVNGIWLIGGWLGSKAAVPGMLIWAAFHILAMSIQLALLVGICCFYVVNGVFWFNYDGPRMWFILALLCAVAPFLQIFPAQLLFMWSVIKNVK